MSRFSQYFPARKFFAELFGTMVLVLIAKGAAIALSTDKSGLAIKSLPGSLSGGMGVMMGILITGGTSGGHINPCVSLAMAVGGRLPWVELPAYIIAQLIGAGAGAVIVLICYIDSLEMVSPTILGSSQGLSSSGFPLVLDQFVASYLLLMCIISVVEQGHQPGGLLVGLSVAGIGLGYGGNAGAAMNPAVDFIPRIIGGIWSGINVFNNLFFLVPLLVPFVGGVAAMLTYRFLIGLNEESSSDKAEEHEDVPLENKA